MFIPNLCFRLFPGPDPSRVAWIGAMLPFSPSIQLQNSHKLQALDLNSEFHETPMLISLPHDSLASFRRTEFSVVFHPHSHRTSGLEAIHPTHPN